MADFAETITNERAGRLLPAHLGQDRKKVITPDPRWPGRAGWKV